ncbi:hypothetical protein [Agreia pratensis]|uniref:Uncharacterized protein n=1 Tax=Agreia pratensis TaxID=150121 RepID=A0A1X7JMU8_9MICO|nr:hypothetical protein [Agreia pratensis]SMG29540.1 hypothetical protein SAMN06296010_1605 [Agreia pratensis]
MPSRVQLRFYPARRLLVREHPVAVLSTIADVFVSRGFHPPKAIDESTIELEIGSAAREFWLGDSILADAARFVLPARARALVVHGFAVAQVNPSESAGSDHPETWLTVSAVSGLETHDDVVDAVAQCIAHFASNGLLVDAGEPISALELPADSPCNPKGFRVWRRSRRRG